MQLSIMERPHLHRPYERSCIYLHVCNGVTSLQKCNENIHEAKHVVISLGFRLDVCPQERTFLERSWQKWGKS